MLLSSQIPLVGIALTLRDKLPSSNIATTFAIALTYEFSICVIIFIKKVWQKLEPDLVNVTAQEIKYAVINTLSRFPQRYKKKVIYEHRIFNVSGLRIQGMHAVEVEQVFVELRIAPEYSKKTATNLIGVKENPESQTIWTFLQKLKKYDGIALSIIGSPGCGKTTLLQHIALTLAKNKQRRYGFKKTLFPIFLFLRQHLDLILKQESPNLAELAQNHFSNKNRYPHLLPPNDWFKKQLLKGTCLVLLDGLDEVANPEDRIKVSRWVDQQIQIYPRSRFLLTARPYGYESAPLTQAHVLEVMSFNRNQVQKFIENWYLANTIFSYGKDDPGVRQDAKRKTESLLYRLDRQSAFKVLMTNPLLLTMITMVHNYRNVLPEHRGELYSEICDVLLSHWGKAKELEDRFSLVQKRSILYPLAYYMMKNRIREISLTDAISVMKSSLQKIGLSDNEIPVFLYKLQNTSGLILEKEVGIWSFAHLTFQEYLCTVYWKETNSVKNWKKAQWLPFVSDSWWAEALRLYAAANDASMLAEACLERSDNLIAMSLACDIAEEGHQLNQTIRRELDVRINRNLESMNEVLFRQAARVFLYRSLQQSQFHDIDEKRKISQNVVTCAEYQLFLEEIQSDNEFHQPVHWRNKRFISGQAKQPIAGVCFKDAEVFCAWLTQKQGKKYRLPTIKEATAFPCKNSGIFAIWTQEQKLFPISLDTQTQMKEQLSNIQSEFIFLPDFLNLMDLREYAKQYKYEIAFALHGMLIDEDLQKELEQALQRQRRLDRILRFHEECLEAYIKKQELQKKLEACVSDYERIKLIQQHGGIGLHDKQENIKKEREIEQLREQVKNLEIEVQKSQTRIQNEEGLLKQDYLDLPDNSEPGWKSFLKKKIDVENSRIRSLESKLASDKRLDNERTLLADVLEYVITEKYSRAVACVWYLNKIINVNVMNTVDDDLKEMKANILQLRKTSLNEVQQRQVELLDLAIEAALAIKQDKLFEWRGKNIELMLRIAIYANQGSKIMKGIFSASSKRKQKRKKKNKYENFYTTVAKMDKVQKITFGLYWYCRIMQARWTGELPAWESIRIVQTE